MGLVLGFDDRQAALVLAAQAQVQTGMVVDGRPVPAAEVQELRAELADRVVAGRVPVSVTIDTLRIALPARLTHLYLSGGAVEIRGYRKDPEDLVFKGSIAPDEE